MINNICIKITSIVIIAVFLLSNCFTQVGFTAPYAEKLRQKATAEDANGVGNLEEDLGMGRRGFLRTVGLGLAGLALSQFPSLAQGQIKYLADIDALASEHFLKDGLDFIDIQRIQGQEVVLPVNIPAQVLIQYHNKRGKPFKGFNFNGLCRSYISDSKNSNWPAGARYLAEYGRVHIYDASLAILADLAAGRIDQAKKGVNALIELGKDEQALGFTGGWHFSYNTSGDSWLDPRAPMGGTLWAIKAIYEYVRVALKDSKLRQEAVNHLDWTNEMVKELVFQLQVMNPEGSRYGLIRAMKYNALLDEINPKTAKRYTMDEIGYRAYQGNQNKISEQIIFEHNADLADVYRLAAIVNKEAGQKDMAFVKELSSRHEILMNAIWEKAWVGDHFVTAMNPDGTLNESVAIDNNTWLAQVFLPYDEERAWQAIEYVWNEFRTRGKNGEIATKVEDLVLEDTPASLQQKYANEKFAGISFFDEGFSDPYVSISQEERDKLGQMVQPEATFGYIHFLLEFARATKDDIRRQEALNRAELLYKNMTITLKALYPGAGLPYATLFVLGYFNTLHAMASTASGLIVTKRMQGSPIGFVGVQPPEDFTFQGHVLKSKSKPMPGPKPVTPTELKAAVIKFEREFITLQLEIPSELKGKPLKAVPFIMTGRGSWSIQPFADSRAMFDVINGRVTVRTNSNRSPFKGNSDNGIETKARAVMIFESQAEFNEFMSDKREAAALKIFYINNDGKVEAVEELSFNPMVDSVMLGAFHGPAPVKAGPNSSAYIASREPLLNESLFAGIISGQEAIKASANGERIVTANMTGALRTRQKQNQLLKELELDGEWEEVQNTLQIEQLIFSPGGIQNAGLRSFKGSGVVADEFGNRPHWVYKLVNTQNKKFVYVGPDDIITLFSDNLDRKEQISEMRSEKENILAGYRNKALVILKLRQLLELKDEDLSKLEFLLRPAALGDIHFGYIDVLYVKLQEIWRRKYENVSLEKFIDILDDLGKLIGFLKQGKQLSAISPEEFIDISVAVDKLERGVLPEDNLIARIMVFHKRLLDWQNRLINESADWAQGRAGVVSVEQEAKTPAYHANLWIANRLSLILKNNGRKPLILDVGANLSVFWRILRQVLGSDFVHIADGVVDLEQDIDIYNQAPNPNKIYADISELSQIKEASDDFLYELLKTPNNFDIIVASFILDQLTPEQLRKAIVVFEGLLARPPNESLSINNLDKFPLLVIASPEHSPIQGLTFDKILRLAGYEVVIAQFNPGSILTQEASARILEEEGPERLRAIRGLTAKPFHVVIYAKTKSADMQQIEKIKLSDFTLRQGQRRIKTEDTTEPKISSLHRLNPDTLYNLDIIASLRPQDFQAQGQEIVTREAIQTETVYQVFENRLACLMYFNNYLTAQERPVLNLIVHLWDREDAVFLSREQVDFVMQRPYDNNIKRTVGYRRLIRDFLHLKEGIDEKHNQRLEKLRDSMISANRMGAHSFYSWNEIESAIRKERRKLEALRYTLWDIYTMEESYRSATGQESIFEQTRTFEVKRIRQIKEAVEEIKTEGTTPSVSSVAKRIGISQVGLSGWAGHHNIDLERLGVITLGPVDIQYRINKIKIIVADLTSKGKVPNATTVAKELGLANHAALVQWANRNSVDLENAGVLLAKPIDCQQRIDQIKRITEKLKDQGKVPNATTVAKELGLANHVALVQWANRNSVDLENAGVLLAKPIDCQQRIDQIKRITEKLKDQGKVPNATTVAKELGFTRSNLRLWCKAKEIDLETLGIVDGRKVDAQQRAKQIETVVVGLKEQNKIPYLNIVAERIDLKSGFALTQWANRNSVDLEKLGIVVQADAQKIIEDIKAAVAELQAEDKVPNITVITHKLGFKSKGSLSEWAKLNNVDLKTLGVIFGQVDIQTRIDNIKVAVADLMTEGRIPDITAVTERLGYSSISTLSGWAERNSIDLKELGVVSRRQKKTNQNDKKVDGTIASAIGMRSAKASAITAANGSTHPAIVNRDTAIYRAFLGATLKMHIAAYDMSLASRTREKFGNLAAVVIDENKKNRDRIEGNLNKYWGFDEVLAVSNSNELKARLMEDKYKDVKFILVINNNSADLNQAVLNVYGFPPIQVRSTINPTIAIREYLINISA